MASSGPQGQCMYVCIFLGELTNNVLASWHVWGRQVVDISAMLIKMQFQSEGFA